MAKQKFNKVDAYDELIGLFTTTSNPVKPSDSIRMLQAAQDYLQKLHDDAFSAGFEEGMSANEKILEP